MAVLYTQHFVQFFDNNGEPLAGGLLYTYEAGTVTPKATYTTAAGDIQNANPVVLDAYGRAVVFIEGAYKFRLETAGGVLVRETDNVSSFEIASAATGAINWAAADTLASDTTVPIGAATSNYIIITGTATINGFDTIAQGAERLLRFNGSATLVHNATSMILPSGVNIVTQAGDVARFISEGAGNWRLTSYLSGAGANILRDYIDGFVMSTAGASTTMTIAAGQAANSTNAAYIALASSISKTTGSWAVGTGNGGLDTGTIANGTWYAFYAIRRPDTGVVDVLFSTNGTSPTLPANYTQFRRIGWGLTNSSGQWTKFTQVGQRFDWDVPVSDINVNNPGTSAVTRVLSAPPLSTAQVAVSMRNGTTNDAAILVTPLDVADTIPSLTAFTLIGDNGATASYAVVTTTVRLNASSQCRTRQSASGASDNFRIITSGWIDTRGAE